MIMSKTVVILIMSFLWQVIYASKEQIVYAADRYVYIMHWITKTNLLT